MGIDQYAHSLVIIIIHHVILQDTVLQTCQYTYSSCIQQVYELGYTQTPKDYCIAYLKFISSYDIYHYGHANQFLQAKQMGSYLIAGIHPDKVIMANKGPPVIKEDERYRLIRSVRFVDDVMEGIGYDITPAMLDAAGCDICVHGGKRGVIQGWYNKNQMQVSCIRQVYLWYIQGMFKQTQHRTYVFYGL